MEKEGKGDIHESMKPPLPWEDTNHHVGKLAAKNEKSERKKEKKKEQKKRVRRFLEEMLQNEFNQICIIFYCISLRFYIDLKKLNKHTHTHT